MAKKTIKTLARQAQDELLEESQNSALLQEDFATKAYQMDVLRIETTFAWYASSYSFWFCTR